MHRFNWFLFIFNILLGCLASVFLILFTVAFAQYPLNGFKEFIEMALLVVSFLGFMLSIVTSLLNVYNENSKIKQTVYNICLLVAEICIVIQLNNLWHDLNNVTGWAIIFYVIVIYYLPFFMSWLATAIINIIGICTDEKRWIGLVALIVNILGTILCYGLYKDNWQISYTIIDILLFVSGVFGIISFIRAVGETV